jgi:sulfur-oxidizing protein SoxY
MRRRSDATPRIAGPSGASAPETAARSVAELDTTGPSLPRRGFLAGSLAIVLLPVSSGQATPAALAAAIRQVTGDAPIRDAKVRLDVPPLVENGNAVPLTVSVESPMSAADYVRAIHVFNEKNPQPHVFHATLGPRNGRAVVATRIKLNDSQKVVAVAELSSGEFCGASVEVVVTLAACVEEPT